MPEEGLELCPRSGRSNFARTCRAGLQTPLRSEELEIHQDRTGTYTWRHRSRREGAIKLLAVLEGQEREAAMSGVAGPNLAAADMHPWVWDVAASLWDEGYRREAVQAAATSVFNSHLPAKLGLPAGTLPRDLANAFSTDPPTATQPRLCLPGYTQATETGRALTTEQSSSDSPALLAFEILQANWREQRGRSLLISS